MDNTEIIIALPLYVESAPGILLEFLELLPVKITNTRMSFILQGGFAGPEVFPFYMRVMLSIMFKTVAKKRYAEVANEWGSKRRIDYKPWI